MSLERSRKHGLFDLRYPPIRLKPAPASLLVDVAAPGGGAKLLMMAESAVSAITVLLVAARSVNIFR